MININGKEWNDLTESDISAVLSDDSIEESFFYEFKSDKVSTDKLVKEIAAFANTFGGYVFLGVSDNKETEHCVEWDEQRIHTTIHDSISPIPLFDIKRFIVNGNTIYVIKVEESPEPPYITNKGLIFERVSSGSFKINDSSKLLYLYSKHENQMKRWEDKITIPEPKINIDLGGYLDIGFILLSAEKETIATRILNKDLSALVAEGFEVDNGASLSHIGESIVFNFGGLLTNKGYLPAHLNNFIEIMADGSAKMRVLLTYTKEQENKELLINYAVSFISKFRILYSILLGDFFPDGFICAKKYEKLTVINQFNPTQVYDEYIIKLRPDLKDENELMKEKIMDRRNSLGTNLVITDDRIPKNGLYTVDKRNMERWHSEYSANGIIEELFSSRYFSLGGLY